MLGHKVRELRTTERYAKFDPKFLRAAVDAIDDYFAELQTLVKRPLILKKEQGNYRRPTGGTCQLRASTQSCQFRRLR